MKYVLKKDDGYYIKKFKELKPNELKALTSEMRLQIVNELKKEPMYPNQLAKKLKIHEQKIYYHINELKKAGILNVVKTEEIKGSLASYYGVKADAFGIEIDSEYEKINLKEKPNKLRGLFKEFIKNGELDGIIVVGSPVPHGPFKAVARDGHYAAQLGLLIGSLMTSHSFSVRLDTDAINEKRLEDNMILIGGPGTNLVTARVNEHLPAKFNEENYWTSIKSGSNEYTDDSSGLIVKMPNPFNKEKTIIVLAGLRVIGTKSCIIALMKKPEEFNKQGIAKVIKGFDFDGDGKIDGVEILE